jgi:hypothetical protein
MKITDVIFRIIIPVVSIVVTLYLTYAKYRLKDYIKNNIFNWHHHIALVLGDAQRAIGAITNNQLNDALTFVGKVEGASQVLLKESAMLVCTYERPSLATIDRWAAEGRIDAQYIRMFQVHAKERWNLFSCKSSRR